MFPSVNPTTTNAWAALESHFNLFDQIIMKDLFFNDEKRFCNYSLQFEDILFENFDWIWKINNHKFLRHLFPFCE